MNYRRSNGNVLATLGLALLFLTASRAEESVTERGQHVAGKPDTMVVHFGMSLADAEHMLKTNAVAKPGYIPKDIVKTIKAQGLSLEFDQAKLTEIEFTRGFDFSLGVSPFTNSLFNPQSTLGVDIKIGMPIKQFLKIGEDWKRRLKNAGYREVAKSGALRAKEFEGGFTALDGRHYYSLSIGPSRKLVGGMYYNRVFWNLEFSLDDDRLKRISAVDTQYSSDWDCLLIPIESRQQEN